MKPETEFNTYPTLRAANTARQALWDPENKIDLAWRINELAGEAGEVCNMLKKLQRERIGLPGSRVDVGHVMQELADVVICLDLVLMTAEAGPLFGPTVLMGEDEDLIRLGIELSHSIGRMSRVFLMSISDETPSTSAISYKGIAFDIYEKVSVIARVLGVASLDYFVALKFNQTSRKVGLPVLLDIRATKEKDKPNPS